MKKILIPIIIVLLITQCKKSTYSDLSGSFILKGVAVIYDTLNGVTNLTPAKNYKVYLRYSANPNTFLYSTTADGQGLYSFSGIDPSQNYIIYAQSDTGTVKYYGELPYTANTFRDRQSDSLKLYPSDKTQNGIHLIVTDDQSRPVPNTTAWVFNNAQLFAADTSAGRVFDMITNAYGIANKFNIPGGVYYLRVKTRIGNLDLAGETSINVPATGIRNAHIILRNTPLPRNGIEVTITDKYITPVSGATVYGYRSQYLWENDTISYNQSLFAIPSNGSGVASTYIIEPGTYYLRAIKGINKDTLVATAIVPVSAGTITKVPMTVN